MVSDRRFDQYCSFSINFLSDGSCARFMVSCCLFLFLSPEGEQSGKEMSMQWQSTKHNAHFGNHAIWMCFHHTDFPKTLSFDHKLFFPISYLYHVQDSQSIIQTGPCLYWSKAKLLGCAECSVNDPSDSSMSVYRVPSAERQCGLSAWRRHWIQGILALNETTTTGRRHAPVRRTITRYILYAAPVTRAVSQCLLW